MTELDARVQIEMSWKQARALLGDPDSVTGSNRPSARHPWMPVLSTPSYLTFGYNCQDGAISVTIDPAGKIIEMSRNSQWYPRNFVPDLPAHR